MIRTIKYIILILCAAAISSCSEEKEEMPKDLIPQDIFVQILADLHIAETELVVRNLGGGEVLKLAPSFYRESFNKHNVDIQSFEKTFNYYTYHTEEFESVYEKVVVELSKRQAELSK